MKVQKFGRLSARTAAHTRGGGRPGSIRLRPGAIAALLLFALGAGAQAPAAAGDSVGPGCDPARPAVAYRAGLGEVTSHQGNRPIPCAVVTGSTFDDSAVAVSQQDGTIVYAPQSQGTGATTGVRVSKDQGATFQTSLVPLRSGSGAITTWLSMDPQTNRLWFAVQGPRITGCSGSQQEIRWSDDEGQTWNAPPDDTTACRQLQGGMSVAEGPAPAGQPQPVGYPHVVYHCGNVTDGAVPLSVHCWKTLDGGQTWSIFQGPNNPPSDCNGKFGGRGRAVGRDGTLYMSVECQPVSAGGASIAGPGPLYLASSVDEGNTWSYQFVTNTSWELNEALLVSSLAIDQAGNLYIVWVDAQHNANLVVGKGSKWGTPLIVNQPGVNFVNRVAVAVNNGIPGNIAIAYVGSTGPVIEAGVLDPSSTFNGYISESNDALGSNPTFLGAAVADNPIMSSAYAESETSAGQGRIWLLTAAFAPDGTPYGSFMCGELRTERRRGGRRPSRARTARPRRWPRWRWESSAVSRVTTEAKTLITETESETTGPTSSGASLAAVAAKRSLRGL
jgi:hypothetical protein